MELSNSDLLLTNNIVTSKLQNLRSSSCSDSKDTTTGSLESNLIFSASDSLTYLKDLLEEDSFSDETQITERINETGYLEVLTEDINRNCYQFSDSLATTLAGNFFAYSKEVTKKPLLTALLTKTSSYGKKTILEAVRSKWSVFCRNQISYKLAKILVDSADDDLYKEILAITLKFLCSMIGDDNSFSVLMKIINRADEQQRTEMWKILSAKPEMTKCKYGFLIFSRLLKEGVDKDEALSFAKRVEEIGMKGEKNSRRLIKSIEKQWF